MEGDPGPFVLPRARAGFAAKAFGSPWPRRPGGGLCRSLAVADVDLDTRVARALPPITSPVPRADGVHALVWWHGEPIGQVTVLGDSGAVLQALPALAERELEEEILEHSLRDLLATEGGSRSGPVLDPLTVAHAPAPRSDASMVTVAVCTRDRPDDLRRCLEAIAALRAPVAEVLVVDNASADDRTRQVAESSPRVRYVREPRRGLDWARNRALLEARTPLVAFTDDDTLVHAGWVDGILHAFADEPEAVAVTGLVVPAELTTPAQILAESQGGFNKGFRRKWISVAVDDGEVAARRWPQIAAAGVGANMAYKREPVLALGGFDPALDVGTPTGGGGDHEMFLRLVSAGHLLVYEPSAVVRHKHRATMEELARQRRGDGTSSYSLYSGAARRYGSLQRRALIRYALGPAAAQQVLGFVSSAVRPRMRPVRLRRAVTGGAVDAVLRRLYRRSLVQAHTETARHPDQPATPPLVYRPAVRRTGRAPDATTTVDLSGDALVGAGLHPAQPTPARRLRVHVTGGGVRTSVVVDIRGSRASSARLRWELVAALGTAVVAPRPGTPIDRSAPGTAGQRGGR